MTTRAEVARTDNSKLGRVVLNNRAGQTKRPNVAAPVVVAPAPAPKKTKKVTKKVTKKSSSKD